MMSRVEQEMICLQTDQGKVIRFFTLLVRLTYLCIVLFVAVLSTTVSSGKKSFHLN